MEMIPGPVRAGNIDMRKQNGAVLLCTRPVEGVYK